MQNRGHWAEDRLAGRCTFPIGPWNTWSNGAYLLSGGALIAKEQTSAAWVMGGSLIALGIGSGLYHGFKTLWANRLDWTGMYLVFGALAVHGMAPHHPLIPWAMLLTGALLAALLAYVVPNVSLEIQMGVLVWFAALPVVLHGHGLLLIIPMSLLVIAYGAWHLDQRGWSGRWGHALWHVLTAFALALLFWAQQ